LSTPVNPRLHPTGSVPRKGVTAKPDPGNSAPRPFSLRGPWSRRRASLISGVGLTGMAILMPVGYFGAIVPLVAPGDAATTAHNIAASPLVYLAGLAAIAIVIVLDVVVAVAWYWLFRRVDPRLSLVAAWLRLGYTVLFAMAAAQLVIASMRLDDPARALDALDSFGAMWPSSLGLFGIHLLVIGYLAIRASFIAPIFGVLLMVAGVGYIADALGVMFGVDLPVTFGTFTFVGEVAVIVWSFVRGRRLAD
jgi:hypothetical protein